MFLFPSNRASSKFYTDRFYMNQREGSLQSAREIVPILLSYLKPQSVIDIGCGLGTWLSVIKQFGVEDIWGIDGPWVDTNLLEIPPSRFIAFDLRKPFRMDRHFDLVLSLEVAEHLPPESATTFVDTLVGLGRIILFSAAIPFQGGTNHLNEQWPTYWAGLFKARGYVVIDCIRPLVWENSNVRWFYAQNVMLFVHRHCEEAHHLKTQTRNCVSLPLSLIHPEAFKKMPLKSLSALLLWRASAASRPVATCLHSSLNCTRNFP